MGMLLGHPDISEEKTFDHMSMEEKSEAYLSSFKRRKSLVKKYSWAIPTPSVVEWMANCGGIVEVGAGNGYCIGLMKFVGMVGMLLPMIFVNAKNGVL